MHTVWKGAISFGLVTIPVKLHAATEDKGIKLRQLHAKCKKPIKQEKTCPICNEDVGSKDLVKGYEYATDRFVAKVKARGWTSGGKLRLPQIMEIK